MSTQIIEPTPSMRAGAAALLDEPERWTHARRKADGREFFILKGRTGTYYTAADGMGCTCPGFTRRGLCSHALAATMRECRLAARQPAIICGVRGCRVAVEQPGDACPDHVIRRSRYDDLFPAEV